MSKLSRVMAWQLSQARERKKAQHRNNIEQATATGLSKAEFQKKFPYLPLKSWYVQFRHVGLSDEW